jgi:hypothetical protein
MNLDYSAKTKELIARCETFMRDVVYPNEHAYLAQHAKQSDHWACPPIMEDKIAADVFDRPRRREAAAFRHQLFLTL